MSVASSVQSGSFAESVKEKTRGFVDNRCWVCQRAEPSPQICHVIAKDDPRTKDLQERGLINFDLEKECNAVALRPCCHAKFDQAADPGLIFFPTDLDYFIETAGKDGQQHPQASRKIPTAEEYRLRQVEQGRIQASAIGGLYQCFDLKPELNPLLQGDAELQRKAFQMEQQTISKPKPWHDAPIAAIRRAIATLGSFSIDDIVPADQINRLTELRKLYGKVDNHAQRTGNFDQPESSKPKASKKRKRSDEDSNEEPDVRPSPKVYNTRFRSNQEDNKKKGKDVTTNKKQFMTACWNFGPEMSAQDIIDMFIE